MTPTRRLFFPYGQVFLAAPNMKRMYKIAKKHRQLVIRVGRIGVCFNAWNDHLCDKTRTLSPAKTFCLHK